MKKVSFILMLISFTLLFSVVNCSDTNGNSVGENPEFPVEEINFFYGADLSYVNEMLDCGAAYKTRTGQPENPYRLFKDEGANLVRLRLWHNPQWTNYSNFEDVKLAMQRVKAHDMKVLLDFHYSDTWADPDRQQIPEAWKNEINNTEALGELLYNYTYSTLLQLKELGLTPSIVQIGNEINGMILQDGELEWPIDWDRNAHLLNKGIQAVKDLNQDENTQIETMLHIAQPENALWWFEQAISNNITDFDWIGLSYYPKWSEYTLENVGNAFSSLITTYNKKLMVVETAYPFTLDGWDDAGNILGSDALIDGYSASTSGQLDYLIDLKEVIANSGGQGLIYWEPAWVSTNCSTLWGQGSHWENATMFDANEQAHEGISFYNENLND